MKRKISLVVGMFFILIGIGANQKCMRILFGPYLLPSFTHRLFLLLAEISLLTLGYITIVSWQKKWLPKLYITLITIVLSLLLAEIYFRLFNPQIITDKHGLLFRYHHTLGWEFIPGVNSTYASSGEFYNHITINTQGFRDKLYTREKPKGKKRIAILGDSFTSGLEVESDSVFTEILEQKLTDVEVLNFGVNGYGLTQEYLLLKDTVLAYDPNLIIIVVYIGNDFDDTMGTLDWDRQYDRPLLKRVDDRFEITNIPIPLPHARPKIGYIALPRLHIIEFLKRNFFNKYALKYLPNELKLAKKELTPDVVEEYQAAVAIIRRMAQEIPNTSDFLIVLAPTQTQVSAETVWKPLVDYYQLSMDDYDLNIPNKKLREELEKYNIPVHDLLPDLKTADSQNIKTYFLRNRHWTTQGHTVVAKSLSEYLEKNYAISENLVETD